MSEPRSVLVFGIGNPARGDDALGVRLIERMRAHCPAVEVLEVFQLQVEHALDLCGVDLVLFCDAAVGLKQSCELREIEPGASRLAFSHAMSPQAVLDVFERIHGYTPPPAFLLAMRADSMGLGETLSSVGEQSLESAWTVARRLCAEPSVAVWRRYAAAELNSP